MYTGNTEAALVGDWFQTVYPCVYREHNFHHKINDRLVGLSLCIQGTRTVCPHVRHRSAVYPCVYREHAFQLIIIFLCFGLSLCIQGTLIITYCLLIKIGGCKILPTFLLLF